MIAGGRRLDVDCARAPQPPVLWALVLAGFAAAGCTFALALGSDHVNEPGLQAALMSWITLPYVFAGVIAWWRRPDSRSACSWSSRASRSSSRLWPGRMRP